MKRAALYVSPAGGDYELLRTGKRMAGTPVERER